MLHVVSSAHLRVVPIHNSTVLVPSSAPGGSENARATASSPENTTGGPPLEWTVHLPELDSDPVAGSDIRGP